MRVLFTAPSGAGHVMPMLPLARALAALGHEILWACEPDARAWIGETWRFDDLGLPTGRWAVRELRTTWPEFDRTPPTRVQHQLAPRLFGQIQAAAMLPGLEAAIASWRPRLVVHDVFAHAAPLACALAGIPHVSHAFGLPRPPALVDAAREYVGPLWRVRKGGDAPTSDMSAFGHVDICPAPLRMRPDCAPGPVWKMAPLRIDSRTAPSAPRGSGARALVTFGTVHTTSGVLDAVLRSLADSGWQATAATGHGHPALDVAWPPHLSVHAWLPLDAHWSNHTATICHAGAGTLLGSLAHGVPVAALPQAADNFRNAEALSACGAGLVRGDDEPVAAFVRHALERLHDERSFAHSAREVAAHIAAMPTPDDVARTLTLEFAPPASAVGTATAPPGG